MPDGHTTPQRMAGPIMDALPEVRVGEQVTRYSEEYRYAGQSRYRPRTRSMYWASCPCGWTTHGSNLPAVRRMAKEHSHD